MDRRALPLVLNQRGRRENLISCRLIRKSNFILYWFIFTSITYLFLLFHKRGYMNRYSDYKYKYTNKFSSIA